MAKSPYWPATHALRGAKQAKKPQANLPIPSFFGPTKPDPNKNVPHGTSPAYWEKLGGGKSAKTPFKKHSPRILGKASLLSRNAKTSFFSQATEIICRYKKIGIFDPTPGSPIPCRKFHGERKAPVSALKP